MARTTTMAKTAKVYRAVILIKYPHSEPGVMYEGPYASRGAATARVTFWRNYMDDHDGTRSRWATGHVEEGVVDWSRVD